MKQGIFTRETVILIVSIVVVVVVILIALCSRTAPECPVCEKCSCPTCQECATDCALCPAKTKTEYVNITTSEVTTILKYVCSDGRTVDVADGCVYNLNTDFVPVLTNEENSSILTVMVKPACLSGRNGGSIYFKTDVLAQDIIYEVKDDAGGEFREVFRVKNIFEGYRSFEICDAATRGCGEKGDFVLAPNKVYLFRMSFNMTVLGQVQHSNEHIIDTNSGSLYLTKTC